MLGAADLGAELGWEPRPDGLEVLYARSKVVADSAAAGIRGPFDIVHLDTRDDTGLEAAARFARSLGFRGKGCIHPAQVDIVNRVFLPDADSVEWAERVIEAAEAGEREGRGAVALDGEMIDAADHRARAQDPDRSEGRNPWPVTATARHRRSGKGRYYEDFDVGDVFRSRFGRTVTDYDNLIFTALTHEHELDPFRRRARRTNPVRPDPGQQHVHARADHRVDGA